MEIFPWIVHFFCVSNAKIVCFWKNFKHSTQMLFWILMFRENCEPLTQSGHTGLMKSWPDMVRTSASNFRHGWDFGLRHNGPKYGSTLRKIQLEQIWALVTKNFFKKLFADLISIVLAGKSSVPPKNSFISHGLCSNLWPESSLYTIKDVRIQENFIVYFTKFG